MKATHKLTGRELTVKKLFKGVALCYTGENSPVFKGACAPKCDTVVCSIDNLIFERS
jgi:hypothetical protein